MSATTAPVRTTMAGRAGVLGRVLAFCRAQPLGAAGALVILIMGIAAVGAEWIAPYDPEVIDFGSMLAPPSLEHPFGTDAFGRDILTRIIYGARTALTIGFLSSFIGCSLGALLGIASAYFGGRADLLIQRLVDIVLSFPIIVLALVVVAVLGKTPIFGVDLNLVFAIAIPIIPRACRVVRSAALSVRAMPYIDAARAGLFLRPHHPAAHGPERPCAVPDPADRLHRAGHPAGGVAVLPRARRGGT